MIDITVNLTDEREAELVALTDSHNIFPPGDTLTPAQFLRRFVRGWLDGSAAQRADAERLRLRAAYNAAPTEVRVQVDTLLDPYR